MTQLVVSSQNLYLHVRMGPAHFEYHEDNYMYFYRKATGIQGEWNSNDYLRILDQISV